MRLGATCPLTLLLGFTLTMGVRGADPPNIVFILADDLGWKDVGYAGGELVETPHIDRLAEQGLIFTAAHSGGPNCSPTRGCLMSGTYTPRHHIYQPSGLSKGNTKYMRLLVPARDRKDPALIAEAAKQFRMTNDLNPDFVCIPEVLKSAGYRSARIGKWHLGPDVQGFDLSTPDGRDGSTGKYYGDVDVAERMTDRALEFIQQNRDRPFFLYLPHWDVHSPYRARKQVVAKYQAKIDRLPKQERDRFDATYAAMIEAVDTSVGRVTAQIDQLGLGDNTLIIFSSDNGGIHRTSQLAPLRGQKGSLFEGGTRVAACMRWTGSIAPGSECDTPITSVDFLPTLAALAGADLPESQPIDGADLSPLLRGQPIDERTIYWHFPMYLQGRGLTIDLPGGGTYSWRGFPSSAAKRGPWKLIHFHESNTFELYNVQHDPGESTNVADQHPQVARSLQRQLQQWQSDTQAPIPRAPNPECVLD